MRGYTGDQSVSFVKWPIPGFTSLENTGEGGLGVYLLVPEYENDEGWSECAIDMATFKVHGVVVLGQQEIERKLWGWSQYDEGRSWSARRDYDRDMAAVVCMGTTGGSWYDQEGASGYFKAGYADFTEEGQTLYDLLIKLYGRKPYILTLLDT